MNLTGARVKQVRVGKRFYTVNLSFDAVLFALQVMNNSSLIDAHKVRLAARTLCRFPPATTKGRGLLLQQAFKLLGGADKKGAGKNDQCIDFQQDADLIRISILQQYHIDLDAMRGRLDWRYFCQLLSGLSEQTPLGQVIKIRTMEVPAPNKYNAEQRRQIIDQKRRFAIRSKHADWHDGLAAFADAIIANAKGK